MSLKEDFVEPRTSFDWGIYMDATLAGLSVLIPIPLVDWLFETIFKRRMLMAIAKRNGRSLNPQISNIMNRSEGCWPGCLMWPINITLEFLKRLYRTILYFLTVKAASDQLSFQWHRAFLFDYMMRRGDLDTPEKAHIASLALSEVLKSTTTSPLIQFAQQLSKGFRHVLATVWGFFRRESEDEVIINTRQEMEASWGQFSGYLLKLAEGYEQAYQQIDAKLMQEKIRVANEHGIPE